MLFPYCPPRSVMPRSQTNARSWVALCRRRRVPPLEISLPLDQNSRRVRLEGSRKVARRSSLGGRCIAAQGHRSILGRPTPTAIVLTCCDMSSTLSWFFRDGICSYQTLNERHIASPSECFTTASCRQTNRTEVAVQA